MILDLDTNNTDDFKNSVFDFCIVGAGAAGITLALQLQKAGFKIALCEAGGIDYSIPSQDPYKGNVIGDPYFTLEGSRLRYFGGSTNHWAGWCRPFSSVDFSRGYLGEEYQWPITEKELNSHLDEASEILEIANDFEYGNHLTDQIKKIKIQFSPPVRFSKKFKSAIDNSKNIVLFLNSNLFDLAGDANRISSATFKSYTGNILNITAGKFILAMGGIENSRFLLWFREKYGDKFFSASTPVGNYWMEHPHFTLGQAIVEYPIGNTRFYSLTGKAQIQKGILGCSFRFDLQPEGSTEAMVREVSCLAPKLGKKLSDLAEKNLICGVRFRASWEQAPTYSNQIKLSDSLDAFGIPRVNLYWKKEPLDRLTLTESVNAFSRWVTQENLGRIRLKSWIVNDLDYPANDELAGNHHMGGTRMASTPKFGVVDKNCKVFGSQNLYIAGSSVFTTSGSNNPTLPIVQLSLRLAQHLMA